MFQANQQIGNYILIKRIGRGGFGEVWLAERRTAILTTKVAVKLPLDEQIDLEAVRQEAELWEKASGHSNVLPIIEANIYDHQVVIVSEYIDGGSLFDKLKTEGRLSPQQAVEMTIGILNGLEFLHRKNIIHRDIKPQNVLLQGETPRLADFGISRAMNTDTMSATISGTDAYMSPESFDGKRNVQTDVWSVGVVLYQLLKGSLPYPQQHPTERMFAILQKEFEPLGNEIPSYLQKIVQTALAKHPIERYQSAKAMREDLQNALVKISHPTFAPTELLDKKKIDAIYETTPKIINDNSIITNISSPPNISPTAPQFAAKATPVHENFEPALKVLPTVAIPFAGKTANARKKSAYYFIWTIAGIGLVSCLLWVGIWFMAFYIKMSPFRNIANNKFVTNPSNTKPVDSPANSEIYSSNSSTASNSIKNSIGMEFVKIPAGTFMMGSPLNETGRDNDEIQHQVIISKDFYLSKYEVTQAQWTAIMGTDPSKFKGDNLPVEQVSWKDVQTFIQKLNAIGEGTYRLPTEAQWEYAARGGTTGANYGNVNDISWYYLNSENRTHPVGQKQANAFGLYDMNGNVGEWCQDWYEGSYSSESVTDPIGATTSFLRVFRGGGWSSLAENLRSAHRKSEAPWDNEHYLGFRLLRTK